MPVNPLDLLRARLVPEAFAALERIGALIAAQPPNEQLTFAQRVLLAAQSGADAEAEALRILGRKKF